MNVIRRALAVSSVISTQDSVHVCQEHSAGAVTAARPDAGAFPTADRVSVMDTQRNATKGLASVSTAGIIQLGTSVKSKQRSQQRGL